MREMDTRSRNERLPTAVAMLGALRSWLLTVALLPAMLLAAPAGATLVAHFAFDGDLTDSSGFGNHGSVGGGTITFQGGLLGQAASFDRLEADFVTVAHSASLNLSGSMTLAAWVNAENPFFNGGVVAKGVLNGTALPRYDLYVTSSEGVATSIAAEAGTASISPTGVFSYGTWHHLAGTYDGSVLALYLDGALIQSLNVCCTIQTSVSPLSIGHRHTNPIHASGQYGGLIDDVRVYDNALSAPEIAALAAVPEPSTAVLLALGLAGLELGRRRSRAAPCL